MDFNSRGSKYAKQPMSVSSSNRGGSFQTSFNKQQRQGNAVIFGIDDVLMNLFCSYVVSQNKTIHKFSVSSLDKLMRSISASNFETNPLLVLKYQFLLRALKDRVAGLSGELIISDVGRHIDIGSLMEGNFIREISNEEVEYVEKTVAEFLNTMTFDGRIANIMKLCQDYQHADYRSRQSLLDNIRGVMSDTMTEFRRNDVSSHSPSTIFRLSSMDDSMEEIHNYISNPSYKLITGMQGFNQLLGGGFQKTRLYTLFSLAGEGKTVSLVNLFYQVWKYNKGYKTKDPTKKPIVVLLTMENLVIEYICSLFHIITRGGNIKNCSSAEACLEEFKARKFEYMGEDDIDMLIVYKPVNSIDTRYLYQITEELEDEGFETIAFFMDYLMRIRPSEVTRDVYVDLGTVANDFKTFAIIKDIPFITASQLNREAAKIIDEGRNSNQANLIRKLGRATIGDSINIDRNIDGSIILIPEVAANGDRYMGYKLTKHRYEIFTQTVSIYQPIYKGSYIALVEDVYDPKPAYKESLARDAEEIREAFGDVERVTINKTIKSLSELTAKKTVLMPELVEDKTPEPEFKPESIKLVEEGIKPELENKIVVPKPLTPIVCRIPKELRGIVRGYRAEYAVV